MTAIIATNSSAKTKLNTIESGARRMGKEIESPAIRRHARLDRAVTTMKRYKGADKRLLRRTRMPNGGFRRRHDERNTKDAEMERAWQMLEDFGYPRCAALDKGGQPDLAIGIECALDCLIRQREDLLREVVALRMVPMTERDTKTGRLVRVGLTNDDNGREVLRAIVDFHNGDAPDLPFSVIFNAEPVRIILAANAEIVGDRK